MNYIYDIVLNFQNKYYEFYEWKKEDKIKNIKKIPLYRVSNKDLQILKYNKVIIDNIFINKIIKDTKKRNTYICIVSNTLSSIAIQFNNKGIILKRSSLIFDEEEEANRYAKKLKISKIGYVENIKQLPNNKLRTIVEKKNKIINYITNNNELITLKYLYYEYFEKECNNIKIIKKELLNELNKEWNSKQNNLYNVIELLKNTLIK